jgi:hypothetical protein
VCEDSCCKHVLLLLGLQWKRHGVKAVCTYGPVKHKVDTTRQSQQTGTVHDCVIELTVRDCLDCTLELIAAELPAAASQQAERSASSGCCSHLRVLEFDAERKLPA